MTKLLDESVGKKLIVTDSENNVVVRVALLGTFYFKNGHTRDVRNQVMSCLADYLDICGEYLSWVKNPETFKWHQMNDSALLDLNNWLSKLDSNDSCEINFHGGEDKYTASQFGITALGARKWKKELSYLKFVLPITWFADHSGSFSALVLNFCKKLHPVSGYGGLGIIDSASSTLLNKYEPVVTRIAQQFPGLEVDYPYYHILHLDHGIKGVNWITVLSDSWLSKLGGLEVLKEEVTSEFIFYNFKGGVVIQAGLYPQMGDRSKNRLPKLYVQLNNILKPIRIKSHYAFHHSGNNRLDDMSSNEWLSRFD